MTDKIALAKQRFSTPEAKALGFDLPELAPGIFGRAGSYPMYGDAFVILTIYSADEGKGNCGRYLDSLPKDRKIIVVAVVNHVLEGMLERRGFHHVWLVPEVDGYVRDPQ